MVRLLNFLNDLNEENSERQFLRQTIAMLTFRRGKAVKVVPETFFDFKSSVGAEQSNKRIEFD